MGWGCSGKRNCREVSLVVVGGVGCGAGGRIRHDLIADADEIPCPLHPHRGTGAWVYCYYSGTGDRARQDWTGRRLP